jgi:hypothetical protein
MPDAAEPPGVSRHMNRVLYLLLLLTLCDFAFAQASPEIAIDQQAADASMYESIVKAIDVRLVDNTEASEATALISELLGEVDRSGLSDDAKSALRREIRQQAFDVAPDPKALVQRLITANDDSLRFIAFDHLLNAPDDWKHEPWLSRRLATIARDPKSSQEVRVAAAWVLKYRAPRAFTRTVMSELVARHDLADLAHTAATILLDDANETQLLAALQSRTRALRETAACQLVWSAHAEDVRRDATSALLHTAKAADEPPRYRGEAIEALSATSESADSHAALIELLNPRWWFFGAQGQHFLIHSLARVIEGLSLSGLQSDRLVLESLRPQVAALRSGEREYVEWLLDNALGIDRPVFHDRVDPSP